MSRNVFYKVFALVLILVFAVSACAEAARTVPTTGVNFRDIHDKSVILGIIPAGTEITVIDNYDGNNVIAEYNGTIGIVYKGLLTNVGGHEPYQAEKHSDATNMVTNKETRIYAEPDMTSFIIAKYASDTALHVVPISSRWFKVIINSDYYGYALREDFYGSKTPESDLDWITYTYGATKALVIKDTDVYDEKGNKLSLKAGDVLNVSAAKDEYIKVRSEETGYTARVRKSVIANGDVSLPMNVMVMKNLNIRKTVSLESQVTGAVAKYEVVTINAIVKTGNGWMLGLEGGGYIYAGYTRPVYD